MTTYLGAYQQPNNYMTFDNNTNDYNYKNLIEKQQAYQELQNMIYFTKVQPPITDDTPVNRDPGNVPCDVRPTYMTNLDINRRESYQQTYNNNPNFFYHKEPAKEGYYKQFNDTFHHNNNRHRPMSVYDIALETSKQDYHGYIIEK